MHSASRSCAEAEVGKATVEESVRKHGVTRATFLCWTRPLGAGGVQITEKRWVEEPEAESAEPQHHASKCAEGGGAPRTGSCGPGLVRRPSVGDVGQDVRLAAGNTGLAWRCRERCASSV